MITILNKYRCGTKEKSQAINVMRGHPLGNPFVIGQHGTREAVVRDYKPYLIQRIVNQDPEIIEALRSITLDSALLCCCAPVTPCHAEVIKDIMEEILQQNDFDMGLQHFIQRHQPSNPIQEVYEDLLDQPMEYALVNPVNCVGVMGRGLALRFKERYESNYRAYQKHCLQKLMKPGQIFLYRQQDTQGFRYIINFPTKLHWRDESRLAYIASGLLDLKQRCEQYRITRLALPRLGCGLGGLNWKDVSKVIQETFESTDIEIKICYQFKLIIAGSRDIEDYALVIEAYQESGFEATEIVSGHARGVDQLGERFSLEYLQRPATLFPADWNQYGKSAGYRRNVEMAEYADGLLALHDGVSKGTAMMIDIARRYRLLNYVKLVPF